MLTTIDIPQTEKIRNIINEKFDVISEKINKIDNYYIQTPTNENIDEILKSVTDLMQKSTGYASLYYIYYILDLNGIKDFEYEFRTLENKLYRDFYYFCMSYAISDIIVPKFKLYNYENENNYTFISDDGTINEKHINNLIKWSGCDPKFVSDLLKININIPDKITGMNVRGFAYFSIFKSNIMYIENNFKWFSEPNYPLEQTIKLLKLKYLKDDKISTFNDSEHTLPVAEHLLNRKINYTKTSWIDISWSFAHNNFLLIDPGVAFADILLEIDPTIKENPLLQNVLITTTLENVLENLFNSKYKTIYKIATILNPKLKLYKYKSIIEPLITEELRLEGLSTSTCENYIKTKELRQYITKEKLDEVIIDNSNNIIDNKCMNIIYNLYYENETKKDPYYIKYKDIEHIEIDEKDRKLSIRYGKITGILWK